MLIERSDSVRNIVLATPAWLRMPTPTTLILATSGSVSISPYWISPRAACSTWIGAGEVGLADGEGHVGGAVGAGALHDHVDVDVCLRQRPEHGCRHPGPVRHPAHRDLGVVARVGDAGDNFLFHDLVLVHHQGAGQRCLSLLRRRISEARQHLHPHPLLHRQLDATGLQHLGAHRGQLQHLLVGDLGQPPRLGHDARVGRVDAVHIRIDVAAIRLQRRRQRHRRGVGAAAPQRGDAMVRARAPGTRPPPAPGPPASARSARPPSIASIRALPWAPSVAIGICQPCQERESTPSVCSAIASSPLVTCSPVATTASYSRASCSGDSASQ